MAQGLSSHTTVFLPSDAHLITLNGARLNKPSLSFAPHPGFEFSLEGHAPIHLFACLYFLWQVRIKEK